MKTKTLLATLSLMLGAGLIPLAAAPVSVSGESP